MPYKTIVALASILFVGCSAMNKQLELTPFEMDTVFPLTGPDCACEYFEVGPELSFERMLLSATSKEARAVVSGRALVLRHTTRTKIEDRWRNNYIAKDTEITVELTEVPFAARCVQYPNPPSHGSCFVGELRVVSESASQIVPVVSVCGC